MLTGGSRRRGGEKFLTAREGCQVEGNKRRAMVTKGKDGKETKLRARCSGVQEETIDGVLERQGCLMF